MRTNVAALNVIADLAQKHLIISCSSRDREHGIALVMSFSTRTTPHGWFHVDGSNCNKHSLSLAQTMHETSNGN